MGHSKWGGSGFVASTGPGPAVTAKQANKFTVSFDIGTMTMAEIAADREAAIFAVLDAYREKITKAYPKVACGISHSINEGGDVLMSIKLKTAVNPSEADEVNRGMLEIWKEVREFYSYVMIASKFAELIAGVELPTLSNDQFANVFRQLSDAKKA